jgi:predicted 3-demethylubiquinone-9 3-methyltransferase (glyoxalase superfamily)
MFVGAQCGRAEEAIELYVTAFDDSRIVAVERFGAGAEHSGHIKQARLELAGTELRAMDSPGPHEFSFTPAISLTVEFDREERVDAAWKRLVEGGSVLMPLQRYEFSPKFGWLQDRFGVTWQLNLLSA